jgi:guanosine-3',5'-bis(diphosphate) 3'-pyrophosphohydrolase
MQMTSRQLLLLDFVKEQHGAQKRKYTFEPYWTHVYRVAEIVAMYEPILGIEIALCHDLLEDTNCTSVELRHHLISIGYNHIECIDIVASVVDLTDVFTHEEYPHYNREKRKILEAERLATVRPISQSVKYADLIDNLDSIMPHDSGFGRLFLAEKVRILQGMRAGHPELLAMCETQKYE